MSELQFSHMRLTHSDEVLDLYNRCHTGGMPYRVFQWKYNENPHGIAIAWTARNHDGLLVGLAPLFSRKLHWHGKDYLGGQVGDAMVDPDYQRQGIFSTLLKNMMNEMGAEGMQFAFAMPAAPTSKSLGAFLQTDPFKKIAEFKTWRRYWSGKTFATRLLKSRVLATLIEPALRLYLGFKDRLKVKALTVTEDMYDSKPRNGLLADSAWLQWRMQSPGKELTALQWDGGGCLLRSEDGTAMLYHIQTGPEPERAMRTVLNYCHQQGDYALYMPLCNSDIEATMQKAGCIPTDKDNDAVVFATREEELMELYDSPCPFFRGDLDVP